jgi:hypothetical protein
MNLEQVRLVLTEALRLFPQPPILIRRALVDDTLPLAWNNEKQVKVFRGTDIFMLFWNLHRSPVLWGDDADTFRPGALSLSLYIYTYIHICIYMCVWVCPVLWGDDADPFRPGALSLSLSLSTHIYTYMHIHVCVCVSCTLG